MYSVKYTKSATKTLRKLPRNEALRIVDKINQYAADPDSQAGNVKQLRGVEGYRLRVGDWRVLFTIEKGELVVIVLKVGARGTIYEG